MEHLAQIMNRISLEEMQKEYAGELTEQEEHRAKYDIKNRLPYRLYPRRSGRPPKKINR